MTEVTPPYKPGIDIPKDLATPLWNFIVEKGKERFRGTAFTTGAKFSERDIQTLKSFYQDVYEKQMELLGPERQVFNDSLREHYLLAERYSEQFSETAGLDPFLLQAVILTHDFGRLFSHRRGRNNAIERNLTNKLGFCDKFKKLLPEDTLWSDISPEGTQSKINKLTEDSDGIAAIVEIIDVLAKWDNRDETKLRRWSQVVESANKAQLPPDENVMWPSELSRQNKMTSQSGQESTQLKYEELSKWFENKYNISIDQITDKVQASLDTNPLAKSWT